MVLNYIHSFVGVEVCAVFTPFGPDRLGKRTILTNQEIRFLEKLPTASAVK